MERKKLVKAEKRTINSKPRLFYNLTPRGYDLLTEYAKQFDRQPREPGEPNLKPSSESDFKKFLKGQ